MELYQNLLGESGLSDTLSSTGRTVSRFCGAEQLSRTRTQPHPLKRGVNEISAAKPMPDDNEIARRALDFQARARDYRLFDIPGYREWSKRRMREGVSPDLIAHLDAMCLLPEDVASVKEDAFEELLEDLKREIGDQS
jgi:hypothetical protein